MIYIKKFNNYDVKGVDGLIIFTIIILFILPLLFISGLFYTKFQSKLQWFVELLMIALILSWNFQAGAWSWGGYYTRWIFPILFITGIFYSWRKVKDLPMIKEIEKKAYFSMAVNVFLIIIFGIYNINIIQSYTTDDETLEISSPLQDGNYLIGQGGNHTQMNYHQAYKPQQYALDIVGMNPLGTRANGLYPKDLERYEIYGHTIYSPCSGTVVQVENNLPDLIPPETDEKHVTGNHVQLQCEHAKDVDLFLAHMQEGSVNVKAGDLIAEGDVLGKVGNSGNTTEPHLHIHAEKDDIGIPLLMNEKFFVRNQIVK